MSLFTDGPPSNVEDLTDQDSGLLDICRIQQIDAGVKLKLAHREIAIEIEAMFEQQRSLNDPYGGYAKLTIKHVAITPLLRMWHTWHTLSLIYRDAYFDQLNDRFQAKWSQYRNLSESARDRLRGVGIGLVREPLPRPDVPILTPTPAAEAGGTFYFLIDIQNKTGETSFPSPVETIQLSAGNAIEVRTAALPTNVQGWNFYAGTSPKTCYQQNDLAISSGDSWVFYPSTAVVNGLLPTNGQEAHFLRVLPRLLPRG